ncbi:MAG: sugar transferase (PEP-CTERM system associated) [Planctomycetota bacterium]|jgi:sugar transferase (PEP-CTERM system associated)
MIHVLRHYFPLRKGLLIISEAILLTLVVYQVMSRHLVGQLDPQIIRDLAIRGLSIEDALNHCLLGAFQVSVLAQIAIGFNELYDFRVSSSRYSRASRFLGSAGSAVLIVLAAMLVVRLSAAQHILLFAGVPFTQQALLLTVSLVIGFAVLFVWRTIFHAGLRKLRIDERVVILGSGRGARSLAKELLEREDTGYQVVGMAAPEGAWESAPSSETPPTAMQFVPHSRRAADGNAVSVLDVNGEETSERRAEDQEQTGVLMWMDANQILDESAQPVRREKALFELVNELNVSGVFVALDNRRGVLPTEDLLRCRLAGVIVEEGEALYERVAGKITVEAMRPSYLIFNQGFVQSASAQAAKRILDIVCALVGIVLAMPLMIATALMVRFSSPGPVLFQQERTGRHDKSFTLLKFRSMREDAEKTSGPVWATADDPRITNVGKFMRKTRLDELPQLWNVLMGDMSMVGPRPERPHFVRDLESKIPYFTQRQIVKPGLTGWAQINYPYGNTLEDAVQKLQYDLFYIKFQSVIFDLSILFNTIKIVVLRRGT